MLHFFNMLLPENINKITKSDFKNEMTSKGISFTNKTRIEVNSREMDKMIKQKKVKPLELKKLSYDPNSQDVKLCAGMPIISRKNNKEMFNVAFCITCHKSQGATFDEPYTIYEFDQFDSRLKYVALSRATDINLINII
jgi:hypothetical protein